MRKINWKPHKSRKYAGAKVGSIIMHCNIAYPINKNNPRWYAYVYLYGIPGMSKSEINCKSMAKAKEDAINLAKELLYDYNAAIQIEMTHWDFIK